MPSNEKKVYRLTQTPGESRYTIDYQAELNAAQYRAVCAVNGPVLVIAGAGSGKTRTLVYRVARLVESGVPPANILLLTFTRRAAREMLQRASRLLDARCGRVAGGTFHSFAHQVLRAHAPLLGFSANFTILDRADAEDVAGLLRMQMRFSGKQYRFPRKNSLIHMFSRAVNRNTSLEQVCQEEYPQFCDLTEDICRLRDAYTRFKQQKNLMDYDDLLIYLRRLLAQSEDVCLKLSRRYRYIMVDEYQDTNKLQADIAAMLAAEHRNIMVVGDDSQSIYSFRGADFHNIMAFPTRFPGATQITIEQNYRSFQPVLDLTNTIIAYAREKYSKQLFSAKKQGPKPILLETGNEAEQSRFVVQRVLELLDEGRRLNEMAVLFRNGWHSNTLEVDLLAANIPFAKYGGFKFMETAHVKDVVAHMRVAANPRDSISWLRILRLIRGIGSAISQAILTEIVDAGQSLDVLVSKRFCGKSYGKTLEGLRDCLLCLQQEDMPIPARVEQLLTYYRPLLTSNYDDYQRRLRDLDTLLALSSRYQHIHDFLADITLDPPRSQLEVAQQSSDEALTLSTIHSAKGLEWRSVFILSAVDGFLPSYRSFHDPEALEEERRLLYVACTRAKEDLYIIRPLVLPGGWGQHDFCYLSRFLAEADVLDHLETWSVQSS